MNDIDTIGVRNGCSFTGFTGSSFDWIQMVVTAGTTDKWLVLINSEAHKSFHEDIESFQCVCRASAASLLPASLSTHQPALPTAYIDKLLLPINDRSEKEKLTFKHQSQTRSAITMNILNILLLSVLTVADCRRSSQRKGPSCSTPAIQNGAAKLKKRGSKIRYKCYRSYSMVGPRQARCVNGEWSPPEVPICVSDGCEEHEELDNGVANKLEVFNGFSVPEGSMMRFACNPGHDMVGDSVIWCDGILWNTSAPICHRPYEPPRISCNFDDVDVDPLCGFSQSLDNNFDWTLSEAKTPTENTGPSEAFEGSKYIFMEASMKAKNETSRLDSPVYDQNKSVDACIKFAFHMHGIDMGVLRVGQFLEGDLHSEEILEELSGNFVDNWQTAIVNVKPATGNFQYFLEGHVGSSYFSDIAVDAIELVQGNICKEMRKSYRPPTPLVDRQQSPSSCWARCDVNGSVVAYERGWREGVCDCMPGCLLGLGVKCCEDYISECSYRKIESRMEIWFWIKWSGPIGIIFVVFVVGGFLLTVARWRVVTPVRREGEEDIVQMIDEEDEGDLSASRGMVDTEEFIDFSLATQCPIEVSLTGDESNWKDLGSRKVTMI